MPQPIADPGWFYSSLAQVTAAIVGFLGGFVILRLLDFMSEWRETADDIVTTRSAFYAKRTELETAKERGHLTTAIESDIDRLWGELVRLLRRRDAAQFPRVVNRLTAGLLVLTSVGIILPLLALEGPSNGRQLAFLIAWVVIVLIAAPLIAREARRQLKLLRGVKLSEESEAEYQQFLLDFEFGQKA